MQIALDGALFPIHLQGEIERFPLYSMGGTLLQVQFACKEDIQGEWLKYFIPEMTHIAGSDVRVSSNLVTW